MQQPGDDRPPTAREATGAWPRVRRWEQILIAGAATVVCAFWMLGGTGISWLTVLPWLVFSGMGTAVVLECLDQLRRPTGEREFWEFVLVGLVCTGAGGAILHSTAEGPWIGGATILGGFLASRLVLAVSRRWRRHRSR